MGMRLRIYQVCTCASVVKLDPTSCSQAVVSYNVSHSYYEWLTSYETTACDRVQLYLKKNSDQKYTAKSTPAPISILCICNALIKLCFS